MIFEKNSALFENKKGAGMRIDLSSIKTAVQVPPVGRKTVKRSIGKKAIF